MIFDTKNPGTPREGKEFEQEIEDILGSIAGVRGDKYSSVVRNIFCNQNIHTGLLYMLAQALQKEGKIDHLQPVTELIAEIQASLVHDLAHLLQPLLMGEALVKGKPLTMQSCSVIIADIMKDVAILNKKQDEYNLGAKGKDL